MAASTPEDPYEVQFQLSSYCHNFTVLQHDIMQVLQVQHTASPDEIKSAYRKLALRNHPDKNQGASAEEAAEKFQKIATAYGDYLQLSPVDWCICEQTLCQNGLPVLTRANGAFLLL